MEKLDKRYSRCPDVKRDAQTSNEMPRCLARCPEAKLIPRWASGHLAGHLGISCDIWASKWASGHLVFLGILFQNFLKNFKNSIWKFFENFEIFWKFWNFQKIKIFKFFKKFFQNFVIFKSLLESVFPHVWAKLSLDLVKFLKTI